LAYTSLGTVTAAVEIWYNPEPTSIIIEEDTLFVKSFFAIPDVHRGQLAPWLLRLELDRAKMINAKLTMSHVAGQIAETFDKDLFVIWSEDNSEKLIIRCQVSGGAEKAERGICSSFVAYLTSVYFTPSQQTCHILYSTRFVGSMNSHCDP